MARRVERLLERFLAEEAEREPGGFEPWLLEARFGEHERRRAPGPGPRRLGAARRRRPRRPRRRRPRRSHRLQARRPVTPLEKFEERAKLQLPLYLLAVAEHWGGEPAGGLYHPLRGTSSRRPRGVVSTAAAGDLAGYGLYPSDVVEPEALEELLEETRRRAGEIVARMRTGEIRRDPGPRQGLRGHDVCPSWCTFAPICRRDRAPRWEQDEEGEER